MGWGTGLLAWGTGDGWATGVVGGVENGCCWGWLVQTDTGVGEAFGLIPEATSE